MLKQLCQHPPTKWSGGSKASPSSQAHLPKSLWGECITAAAHLINQTPIKLLSGKTRYELLYCQNPSYDHIPLFGTLCFAHNKLKSKDKFNS